MSCKLEPLLLFCELYHVVKIQNQIVSLLQHFYLQGEQFDTKRDSVSETDSDSESENASCAQSPVSGSVHYFIAPLESSKAQDLVVEELNQVGVLCYAVFEATGTQIAMKLKLNLTLT